MSVKLGLSVEPVAFGDDGISVGCVPDFVREDAGCVPFKVSSDGISVALSVWLRCGQPTPDSGRRPVGFFVPSDARGGVAG
jgi:hypothetical protein